jgi:LacI family transcriptional regulator, galactose operon repressor
MATTLKDIAREARVDVATVSRALNGIYGVHRDTRKKVLAVASRLNYRPNRMAKGLATGKSHTLGLVVSDIRNPFLTELVRGAEDAAYSAGYQVLLCNSDFDPAKQMRYAHSLLEKRVEGVLMHSVAALNERQLEELGTYGVPIVLLCRPPSATAFSGVSVDNFQWGMLVGSYLIRLRHRVIGHLTGPRYHGNLTERTSGFMKAVEANRKVKPIVIHGLHNYQSGYEMAKKLLAQHRRVTAVFAANDAIAFGVIRAVFEAGLSIPEDISLIGFDNVELASIVRPPLTTVDQPKYEMGQAAVEILLRLAAHPDNRIPEHRLFGLRLVERQSCRPL